MEMKTMSLFGITPFEAPKRRNIQTVTVTVSDNAITIPNLAYEKFGRPQFVEVGFNDEKKFFGIRPLTEETKYAIEVNSTKSHQISRMAIINKIHALRPWDKRIYNLVLDKGNYDNESGYWLFDLDASQEVTRLGRGKSIRRK